MNKLGFYSNVPLYIFRKQKGMPKPLNWESARFLLAMYKNYILHGAKGYIDEDGTKTSHRFDEVKKEDTFLVPTGIFIFWEKGEMNGEHAHAFIYLCYLAYTQKSNIVKINKEFFKNATGLSKTKFPEVIQEIIYHEMHLIKATDKPNLVEIPWLAPDHIKNIEDLDKEMEAIENGEKESSGSTAIPTYFLHNHLELGFTYGEAALVMMFASSLSRDVPRTFDEAVKFVVDHSSQDDNVDAFNVMAAVKKAEKKDILDIIKLNKDGHILISWKGVTV